MDLTKTLVALDPDGTARPVEITDTFWAEIMAGTRHDMDGLTVGAYDYEEDWTTWERHPAGDEVVIALGGAFTLVLEDGTRTRLSAGETAIVPRGMWHGAEVEEPSRAIHLTFGAGTEHGPVGG